MATYLGLDLFTVGRISTIVQTIAYFLLILGFNFARKKNFTRHKNFMTIATALSFISLVVVMIPSFSSIISGISLSTLNSLSSITILHHSLGVLALVMAALVILKPASG